ncbi:MAG: lipid A export permease/ATP-binding protein MsbA [Xanthomonadales bacterium]|nr:Lipid A export ATP-binding/permease protein MsbA [Xanthomonadales bacterium]MCC6594836.1 lipid A export permease/ATP-binding protein MsbA [Xanthomonadales bacterium]MCE7930390.1 lipid A export permease/ATP-binding protein MsbA [Xanthomonadales bacterium PRO6]
MTAEAGSAHLYRRLLPYARPHWPVALGAFTGMLLEASVAAAFTSLMQPLLDDALGARDGSVIAWLPLAIVILFVLRGIGVWIGDYGMAWISRRIIADLRARVFGRYLVLPSRFFAEHASGDVLARLSFQVEQIGQACTEGIKILVLDSLIIAALLGVMAWYSPKLTLSVLLAGPLIAIVVRLVSKRYRAISRRIQASVADVAQIGQDVVLGEREIKVYGGQQDEAERFARVNEHNRRQHLKVAATNALSSALVQILAASSLALVVYVATRPGELERLTPGAFTAFMTAMLAILPSLKRLTQAQALIQRGLAAAESVFAVLDEPGERDAGKHAPERVRGELQLRGVGVRYPGREEDALRGIDLHIRAGETVALVGRSGSGKSTLAALLARFVEVSAGEIQLDGVPLADYRLVALRRQLALVSQQIVLFNDSVARNIAYGDLRRSGPAAIEAAARAAHAHEFIAALPAGYETPIGERGASLSGGQRQRLAIARALLKDAPILILDEATSALDNDSERLVQQALRTAMRGRTTLVIAHRLSTIEQADRIVVLDAGRIVEQGTHAELLVRGGVYAQLYRSRGEPDGADFP